MSVKFSVNNVFTTSPSCVGTNCFLSFSIYLLSIIVVIIGEYVLGLPIPFSSKAFTKLASVYLAGGSVKLCFASSFSFFTSWFNSSFGIFVLSSSSSLESLPSTYSVINPLNFKFCPLALNLYSFTSISTLIVSYTAAAIWLAINLLYISLYNLYWSGVSESFILSGVIWIYVGLIPSCASCASLFCL